MEDDHSTSCGEETNEIEVAANEVPKNRRTRGPSKLEKLEAKGPFALEWDNAGCPTGKYATSFASYCGKRVRCQVDINFQDWDSVEVGLKKLLWEDIAKKYQVNETYKEYVLSSCGCKWKDFKSKLTTKWIRHKHPKFNSPADCYSYIEQVDWEKFKASRETNEFKEKSKKATESVKCKEHPHLMGRRGYNQRIPEWVQESSMSSSSSLSSNSLVVDRSWRWIKARSKSDEKVPNEKTQKVAGEMEEWRKKENSGEFHPNRHDDVLSRSLNKKEHPGRVRGFSGGVSIKDVFGTSHRTSQRSFGIPDKEVVTQITEMVRKETLDSLGPLIRQETIGLLKRMGVQVPENLEELQSSSHSENPFNSGAGINKEADLNPKPNSNDWQIKEPTKCRLACLHNGKAITVAYGLVYPSNDENQKVHGTTLLDCNARVSIDKVLEGTAPLPIPTQYHERVGDAVASFVQWPKELILLGEDSGSHLSCPPVTTTQKQVSKDSKAKTFEVIMSKNMFHFEEDKQIFLSEEDVTQLLRMAFLNVPCIQVFMMFLQELYEKRKNDKGVSSVGYLCPTIMSQLGKDQKLNNQIMNYVDCSLLKMGNVDIVLVSFFQSMHWMLIILFPSTHEAYFCDPMTSTKRDTTFKHLLQIAFRTFKAHGGSTLKSGMSMKWSNIVCPQQPGSTYFDFILSGSDRRFLTQGKRLTRFENYGQITLSTIIFSALLVIVTR